ncbi:MAG: hypothetical protein E7502_03900 [Ruminococcus sp.]|nr:hypothetical protein [Ruminococcus sp.]
MKRKPEKNYKLPKYAGMGEKLALLPEVSEANAEARQTSDALQSGTEIFPKPLAILTKFVYNRSSCYPTA